MSRLLKVISALFGIVVLAYGIGFLLPGNAHVERTIAIQAAPEKVFAQISDFKAWDAWSPWANIDPDATMTVTGSGVGQTMVWASEDPKVGNGSQQITVLESPSYLKTHLEFDGQGVADASFQLVPQNGETQVTWSLDTNMQSGVPLLAQPITNYMGLMLNAIVGRDYETGLENLKAAIEVERETKG